MVEIINLSKSDLDNVLKKSCTCGDNLLIWDYDYKGDMMILKLWL